MGQKSLYCLHKVDTSMIWESSVHNLNYKWLSYNLWFTYLYFYKFMTFNNRNSEIVFNNVYNNFNNLIKTTNWKYKQFNHVNIRFTYHIDLYCLEFVNYLLLINIFFLTNLKFFKREKKVLDDDEPILDNFFL
jgi:hypothetical protein